MPIHVNMARLERGTVELEGEVPLEELEIEEVDDLVGCTSPLKYDLEVDLVGDAVLARGLLEWPFDCHCARCLKPFTHVVRLPDWTCHLALEGDDKVPILNDIVDLTPYAREDTLLDLPQHPLCSEDCDGGDFGPQEPTGGKGETTSPWQVLDNLDLEKE